MKNLQLNKLTRRLIFVLIAAFIAGQIALVGRAFANTNSLSIETNIWSFVFATAQANLAAFLMGCVCCFWFLENRYRLTDKVELIENGLKNNNVLLRRIIKHFEIRSDASDV